jgi:hypothetical protein
VRELSVWLNEAAQLWTSASCEARLRSIFEPIALNTQRVDSELCRTIERLRQSWDHEAALRIKRRVDRDAIAAIGLEDCLVTCGSPSPNRVELRHTALVQPILKVLKDDVVNLVGPLSTPQLYELLRLQVQP